MATDRPQKDPVFGYLSTHESADHGYFGGYLIVSSQARPLEFHCTAPVRPGRAQQILYGPTLEPYLLGEQIGGSLLAEAKLRPNLLLTNQLAVFCLRPQFEFPMVRLINVVDGSVVLPAADSPANEVAAPVELLPETLTARQFTVGGREWELPRGFEADRQVVVDLLQLFAQRVELAEPFARIHDAICEAQRIGERNQDPHGQAA